MRKNGSHCIPSNRVHEMNFGERRFRLVTKTPFILQSPKKECERSSGIQGREIQRNNNIILLSLFPNRNKSFSLNKPASLVIHAQVPWQSAVQAFLWDDETINNLLQLGHDVG